MMPNQLRSLAVQALRANRLSEAIDAYRKLTGTSDATADDWYNLGYTLRAAFAFDEALFAYGEALKRGVAAPEAVFVNRAAIFNDHLADAASAERELQNALQARSDFVPALLNLATIKEDSGDRSSARTLYQRALTIDPTIGRAIARLATLDLQDGDPRAIASSLKQRLAKGDLALDDVGEVGFALGQAFDLAADYDAAFAAFAAANDAAHRANAASVPSYDPVAHEQLIDRIIATFPEPATSSASEDRMSPIFVCGMFRSGSTLAEQILARHSRVTAGGELTLLPHLVASQLQPFPEATNALPPAARQRLRDQYLGQIDRLFPDHDLVTDKRPDNFLLIGLIKALFPSARIIHTKRDPLDNGLSAYFLNFDPSVGYATDLRAIGDYYRQYRRLMQHWALLYPDDIHDFDYDALIKSPEDAIPQLIANAGLDWEPNCLQSRSAEGTVRTPTTWQVRQPLHSKSSGRSRKYMRFLGPLSEALRKD